MSKFIKKYGYLLLIFIIAFLYLYFLGFLNNYLDPINNYGFAKAIVEGEIPYLDFNLISTPLYPFILSLGLHIYNNYLTILIEQSLLVTICFYFLYNIFGKKSCLYLLTFPFTLSQNIMPTYNFCCFFMMILIIYMENKHNNKDYLIGAFIALAILSKQTVGVFLIIPSLIFYHKDIKKLLRRLIGFLVPCFIFLIYLLVNGALGKFFDLCFLGLFDFFNNNGLNGGLTLKYIDLKPFLVLLFCIFIFVYLLIKNKKDINLYYLIFGLMFLFPLIDNNHISYFFNCFVVAIIPYIKLNEKTVVNVSLLCLTICSVFITYYNLTTYEIVFTKKLNHYQYILHNKSSYEQELYLNQIIDKYNKSNKNIVIIGYYSLNYSIYNDKKISYFDVLCRGNFGFNGTNKMIEKIKKMNNCYFFISKKDMSLDDATAQFDKKIARFIMKNYEKVDSFDVGNIYYKK